MKTTIAGNWKMHGSKALVEQFAAHFNAHANTNGNTSIILCPPALWIAAMAEKMAGCGVAIGGQDCHMEEAGAYTGDISAPQLADAGASMVIVGHSERRHGQGETSVMVAAKAKAALAAGLVPIICVGETYDERDAGVAEKIVADQLTACLREGVDMARVLVAYEPVWAIGTGKVASLDDIAAMHHFIHAEIGQDIPVLYGGSVKPGNAQDILALTDVNGVLVGGASLDISSFAAIIQAAPVIQATQCADSMERDRDISAI